MDSNQNEQLLTVEQIKTDFSHIIALIGSSAFYHNSIPLEGYGQMCDVYIRSKDKHITQEQVDKYNEFRANFKSYLPEIETYILTSLKDSELKLKDEINEIGLTLDVLEIPFDNSRYDLVLVCGKTYKKFNFLKRNINIRAEFKNGRIQSIQRKKDTTEENQ